MAIAIAALAVLLQLRAPAFFSPANLLDLLVALLPVFIVAIGATLVVVTGEIDISAGSIFAVCSVVAGALAVAGVPMPLVALAAPIAGAALGAINGALVGWIGLPSIVVTLATTVAWRDALRWTTEGAWVQGLPAWFQWLGATQQAYPLVALGIAAIPAALTAVALSRLPAGRAVYATGSNAEAARLAGLDPRRVRFLVFTIAGACAGLAAIVNAARFSQVPPNTGIGLELQVIAAVIVGGAAITGGRGTLGGTALGVVLLGMMGPALTFLGASAFWERAVQGAIILVAVGVDASRARRHAAGRGRRRIAGAAGA